MTTSAVEIAPGYVVEELLSRGQALDVYSVFSRERLCSATAKTIRPDRADVQRVRDRLLLEGRLLTTLAHPHLIRGFEVISDPVPVVIVETLMGYNLEESIDWRERRLPSTDLAHLGRQLASALQYLHAHGYLHLDVRPANVMAHGGKATLIDLSIAREPGEVRSGFGTPGYMAPEQSRGGVVSAAADSWGLGATLYAAATGVPPLPDLRPVRSRRPRLHPALAEVVDACLSPAPGNRPGIVDVHERLGSVLG
ncbi:MAG: serine/threonine-protein kinase [Nocardioides sp.]